MKDYAMIFCTSRGYMPGTNAILNALEHYGFEGLDVFVLLSDGFLSAEYMRQWQVNFEKRDVTFYLIEQDMEKFRHSRDMGLKWFLKFADVRWALDLLLSYKVVLIWGADVLPVNNFMDYFEISDKLGKVIAGTNEHGYHRLDRLKMEWPYHHHWNVPYADVPLFIPRKWKCVLETMLFYQQRLSEMSRDEIKKRRCGLSHMDGLNYALRECKADVFGVPGELWVQNVPYKYKIVEGSGKRLHFEKSSTELFSVHRKYWNIGICQRYLNGIYLEKPSLKIIDIAEPWHSIGDHNKRLFNSLYRFFNLECRVKWAEGVQVWDGRRTDEKVLEKLREEKKVVNKEAVAEAVVGAND